MKKDTDQQDIDAIYKAIESQEVVRIDGELNRIRHWKIEKILGEGATATVYLGKSLIDDTLVAIKVFKGAYFESADKNDANQKMMRTEAALVGKINHPNILQTYSVGMGETEKYLIMEYVDLGCLEDYINPPKNFSLKKIIKLFYQCACAFQYSDEIGVIHRDVKPANILLTEGRTPKITDFGSSMVKGMEKESVSGVGSPSYMSSEQIRQEPLNQQTDIYSLGAAFFEILTGKKIITAKNQKDLIHQILFVEPPPISKFITSHLPQGLEEIFIKSLKKKQEQRYQTWHDMIVDLSQLIYRTIPEENYVKKVDEVSSFDWVRKCSAMSIFEDSELWDLIQSGIIYKVSAGMAFTIAKITDLENRKETIRDFGKEKIDDLKLVLASEQRNNHVNNEESNLYHTFVLYGGIQSYGSGGDGRIQILQSGDYCANIEFIEKFDNNTQANAFTIDDTIMLSVEDNEISAIHPVVRKKLNTLIIRSQEKQLETLTKRHDKLNIHQAVKEASLGLRLL